MGAAACGCFSANKESKNSKGIINTNGGVVLGGSTGD